jgi:transcriptional regulator with XRE-family HTH domain
VSQIWDNISHVRDQADAPVDEAGSLDARLAARLSVLRAEHGWSLDELAGRTGISRSTLSRLERAEVSPTAALLGRLCTAYGRTLSRLLTEVEAEPPRLLRAEAQLVWTDPATGFIRRSVSPPAAGLRAEVIEGTLPPGADIAYDAPSVPGLEQHIWVLEGAVEFSIGGETHELRSGDCLRFRLYGPTRFHCPGPEPVRYAIVMVLP